MTTPDLRPLLADCIAAIRTAAPHIAQQPVRVACEAVAVRAEQALTEIENEEKD